MQAQMTVDGTAVTQTQIDQINSAFGTNFTLQNPGFGVNASQPRFPLRPHCGLSRKD